MNSCFALIDVDLPHAESSFLSFGSTGHQRRAGDILDAHKPEDLVPGGVKCIPRTILDSACRLLVHQVSDWCSGAAANFDWMREAKRENTRCGL